MVHRILTCLIGLMVILSATGPMLAAQPPSQPVAIASAAVPAKATVSPALLASPVMFIQNIGQWDAGARFQVRGGNNTMWLAKDAIWLTVVERSGADVAHSQVEPLNRFDPERTNAQSDSAPREAANIKISFVGANSHLRIEPFDRLNTVVSYFIGNNPDKWRPAVPVWGGVRYVDLYPGVNLEITSEAGQMVQRLAARPGADLGAVRLRVEGAEAVAVDGDTLRLGTAAGEFVLPLLRADGLQVAGLQVQPDGAQAYAVAAPFAPTNPSRQSRIENPQSPTDNPTVLLFGSFLGGSGTEYGKAIAVDGAGSAYVTGSTAYSDFPTTSGAFDVSYNGGSDVFVVKLNPAGSGLTYATYLGGSSDDIGYGITLDPTGSAYVTGSTASSDFPTTPGAFDSSYNDNGDAFVVKLNPAGSELAYATFLGGSDEECHSTCRSIAVDGAGSACVTGETYSSDFPTTPGAFDSSYNDRGDAFVVKLNPAGSRLIYATYLGGTSYDRGYGIAVDEAEDSIYVTGHTYSLDFPTTPDAFDPTCDSFDIYVVKFSLADSELAYATCLGGGEGFDVAVDAAGSAYVTGWTDTSQFPTTPGAFDPSYNGNGDAFVAKLNPAGSGLAYATFLGGSHNDYGVAIAVDGAGSAYVTNNTYSSDFPTTLGAFDSSYNGNGDAFVAKLNPAGSGLTYATFLGGSSEEGYDYGLALNGAGSAYVTGRTYSSDFPTTPGAFDSSYNNGDAFVAKLAMTGTGGDFTVSGRVLSQEDQPVEGVVVSVGSAGTVPTDANGFYTMTRLALGTYTITPSEPGYSFSPPSRTVSMSGNVTGQDFRNVAATAFLDLPFGYDATEASFVTALYDTDNGGRVSSWFDHALPTYAKNQGILLYDGRARTKYPTYPALGCYEGRCYDGHNGFDFSYVDPQPELSGKQPLSILPAAGGVVAGHGVAAACNDTCRYGSCAFCGAYGNYVVVNHQNGYFTRYAHLNQVYVNSNQSVTTNDALGTMGSTGHVAGSDGTHLHFSVHLDSNGNGQWDEESTDKSLDPCGFMGESDPWVVSGGPVSARLWQYACAPGQGALVSSNQGALMTDTTGRITADIPAGAFSGSATLELSPGPVAGASARLRSAGGSFWLRLLEWLSGTGAQASAAALPESTPAKVDLTQPVTLTVAYSDTDVLHLDVSQLALRLWNEGQGAWQTLPTVVDPIRRVVTSTTQYLGDFDLQAPLLCTTDVLEPDDWYASAAPFWPNDLPLARGLEIPQDEDWVRFHTAEGASYTIRTHGLTGAADTVLTLYDTDALSVLASNDDTGSNPASELTWTAPYAGTYFVKVTSASSGVTDCLATYQLSITTTASLAVTITRAVDGAELTWPHHPLYPNYQVRRSTTPFFTANAWSDLLADVPAPGSNVTASYTDTDAFTTVGTSYFYAVLPTDADGEPYLVSNRVGAFNFVLTPGTLP